MSDGSPDVDPQSYVDVPIQIFRAGEHIRKRPSMYIGDTQTSGLHHLALEPVYNSINEFRSGHATRLDVVFHPDGSATVEDDGSGIPVDRQSPGKDSLLSLICTEICVGRKPGPAMGRVERGLRGIGLITVCALSESVEVESSRGGTLYRQDFSRGVAASSLRTLGSTDRRGTRIRFKPDPEIFASARIDPHSVAESLRELAFLHPGLLITFTDAAGRRAERYHHPDGAAAFVLRLNHGRDVVHSVLRFHGRIDDVRIDLALQYTRREGETLEAFVNARRSPRGTHLPGFDWGFTRIINITRRAFAGGARSRNLNGTRARRGLTAVLSLNLAEPEFTDNFMNQLVNPEMTGLMRRATYHILADLFTQHPDDTRAILKWLG